MRRRLFLGSEQTRAFEHHVHAQRGPWKLRRVALRQHLDAVAVDYHRVAIDLDTSGKFSVRRVVARQIRIGLRAAQIIDGDDR